MRFFAGALALFNTANFAELAWSNPCGYNPYVYFFLGFSVACFLVAIIRIIEARGAR